jgi:hypothetical protein
MKMTRFTLKAFAFLALTLAFATAAQAQATRTWVSGVGDDANPCSRTAPCKTFAGAISKTADGGEIDCLDPGGFGTITLTKSVTLDGTTGAGFGSILAAGTTGVNVNDSGSGAPNTKIIILRNLSINGAGTGLIGINFTSAKTVHVENCQIFGFRTGSGLGINVNLAAGTGQKLFVKNTVIAENSGDGIIAKNTGAGGSIAVVIEDSQISDCNKGITSSTASKFIINRSSFVGNTVTAVGADTGSAGIEVDSSLMQGSSNGLGLVAGTTRIANCRITNNTNGVAFAGGTLVTYGDNKFDGNTNETVGGSIPAPILKK